MPSHEDFPNGIPCPNPVADAMQNYTQYYRYDELGNILQLKSDSNQSRWIRDYIYDIATNRLLRHSGTANEYWYDQHGNITSMPHLHFLRWDYKDQFYNTSNGTYSSFYSYDAQGNRTRKVIDKNNIIETIYYIDGFELYRREVNGAIDYERTTLNISDDEKVFVRVEKKTNEPEIVRYQYDNHLGSACLELDYTGRIISYEEYHPFGTTSYRSGRSETEVSLKRYKYCGKERDEQTGFYYYGMRYYAGWLCRFVSVDPMADEYLSLTPYAYCANNPLKYIDPTGMALHDYGLNEQGYITLLRETDDPTDRLIALDNDGNETDKSIEINKGILNNKKTNTVTASDEEKYTFDQYNVKDDNKATDLFEFVADNTKVEWSLTGVGAKSGANGQNILTTSHKEASEAGGGYLQAYGYTIRNHTHSHPYNKIPSDADKKFAASLNLQFSTATLYIYHKGEYFRYNKDGLIPTILLPYIEIKALKY
jgi:RHS repeat-associated protein